MSMSRAAREWDAATYHRVSGPQYGWGTALLERLELRGDEQALDAGCGTGRLTADLLDRLPAGRVIGLDRSLRMLEEAGRHLATRGARSRLVAGDLCAVPLAAGSADLVVSTATFHWVRDHDRLFAEMARVLRPGGRLVAQCGGHGNIHRVHAHARAVGRRAEFAPALGAWEEPWEFATAELTTARLARAGLVPAEVWLATAPTPFPDEAAFAEFVRTVVLRPWLARLTDVAGERFVNAVTQLTARDDPSLTLDYVRLNLSAHRPA